MAVKMFGTNSQKIRLYVMARSPSLRVGEWKILYENVVRDAQMCGYGEVTDYCADFCYVRMLSVYREKVFMLNTLNSTAPDECEEEAVVIEINLERDGKENVRSLYIYEDKEPYIYIEKAGVKENTTVPVEVFKPAPEAPQHEREPLREVKVSKRLWIRMTEQEKKFEEHFNTVEESTYCRETCVSSKIVPRNPLRFYFPAVKRSSEQPPESVLRRPTTLEEQYHQVISKLVGNKKSTKDKAFWPSEYKVMIRYMIGTIKERDSVSPYAHALQKIANEKHELHLHSAVIKAMGLLQRAIFESKDASFIEKLNSFKNRLCLLYDFYRR
eukprot:jgi/Antlo1/2534/1045